MAPAPGSVGWSVSARSRSFSMPSRAQHYFQHSTGTENCLAFAEISVVSTVLEDLAGWWSANLTICGASPNVIIIISPDQPETITQ
jgi:hypothetical protein